MVITKYTLPHQYLHLKAAVLSDIHDKPVNHAIEGARREKPDVIFIPGDLLTGHMTKEAWDADERENKHPWREPENAVRVLKELVEIGPTYFSLGNHEASWNEVDIAFVGALGVNVLHNRWVQFGDFLIGGLSSAQRYGVEKQQPEVEWLKDYEQEEGYKILLCHEPQLWPEYLKKKKIDLTIAGHAHGGQWRFFGRGVFAPGQGFFPQYTKGLYEERLLVSAGLSNTAGFIPRLFNPTELVVVEIGREITEVTINAARRRKESTFPAYKIQ